MNKPEIFFTKEGELMMAKDEIYSKLVEFELVDKNNIIQFIGLVSFHNIIIFSIPKVYELGDENKNSTLSKLILNVLYKYSKTKHYENLQSNNEDLVVYSDYKYYYELHDIYIRNGLYNQRKIVRSEQNYFEIDWTSTINEKEAIINHKSTFYANMIGYKSSNIHSVISIIHASVLSFLYKKYSLFIEYRSLDETIRHLSDESYILNPNSTLSILLRAKRTIYNQAFIRLVDLLIGFFKQNTKYDINRFITFKFETIWETVVDRLFSDSIKKTKEFVNQYQRIKYKDLLGNEKELANVRPDTIIVLDEKTVVIDSKYYKEDAISEINTYDIIKQYVYYKLQESINNNSSIISTCFILPTISSSSKLGAFSYDLFKGNIIDVLLFNIDDVLKYYLSGKYLEKGDDLFKLLTPPETPE